VHRLSRQSSNKVCLRVLLLGWDYHSRSQPYIGVARNQTLNGLGNRAISTTHWPSILFYRQFIQSHNQVDSFVPTLLYPSIATNVSPLPSSSHGCSAVSFFWIRFFAPETFIEGFDSSDIEFLISWLKRSQDGRNQCCSRNLRCCASASAKAHGGFRSQSAAKELESLHDCYVCLHWWSPLR